jgi:kynurenine formamidase
MNNPVRLEHGGAASDGHAIPGRAPRRRPGVRREQRHRAEHDRGVPFPIHVLAVNAMGIHLLDDLQLEDLRLACEARRRWEFLFVAAPLRIVGGTGSPVNPVAIL